MFCEYCGTAMDRSRCAKCRKHSSAFWFTVLSGFLLLATVVGLYFYYAMFFPATAALANELTTELPDSVRNAYVLGHLFAEVWFLVLLGVALVVMAVLVRMGKFPMGRAGKSLSLASLLLLVLLLAGVGAGEVWTLSHFEETRGQERRLGNQFLAMLAVNDLNRAQQAVAAADPSIGYSCDIKELTQRVSKVKDFERTQFLQYVANDGLGRQFGYDLRITGCSGPKPAGYKILAKPTTSGALGYCGDQSGIRIAYAREKQQQALIAACQ